MSSRAWTQQISQAHQQIRQLARVVHTAAVGLAVGLPMALLPAAGTATAQPLYSDPDPDTFYAAPADLADHRPGDVLDMRAMPPLLMFPGTTVTLVKFASTNSRGEPIAATTTVMTPANHQPDAPLLSYQHIINALGTECAVSHVLYSADPNLVVREAPALNAVLQQGWTVALPDHLGPQLAYGAARLGGQITLDGIRAVKAIPELGLRDSPTAMTGYSGGGMATAWAAALQPTYAPELNLVGAAYGGVPMNLVTMVQALGYNSHPAFGLAMAAAIGLEREYPDRLPISDYMNPKGIAVGRALANDCTNQILATGAGHNALEYAASTALVDSPDAMAVLDENSLQRYDGVPRIPVYEWHSPTDPLIPVDAIADTNQRYCAAGVTLQAQAIPMPEHMTAAVLGVPSAASWLVARIHGEPAPSNCQV